MHYLFPKHRVLPPLEAERTLEMLSLNIEELPPLIYKDAALEYLRMQGEETPVNSVVEITVTRSLYSSDDSPEPADRTKVKYRIIKRV